MSGRSVRTAFGAIAVAFLASAPSAPPTAPPSLALVAALLAVAAAAAASFLALRARLGRPPHRARPRPTHALGVRRLASVAGPVLAGGALVLGRSVVGSSVVGAGSAGALPDGRGPWTAVVETIGSSHDGHQQAVLRLATPGRPLVAATLPRYPSVEPADRVEVEGRLSVPEADPYGDYLRRSGFSGSLRAASLELAGRDGGVGSALEDLRRAAGDGLTRALPEPESGLAAGILVGLRDRVDRRLADAFTTAGVSHIVAISGWNISIVAASVAAVAGRWRRRRRAVLTLAAVVAYTAFAGASPSVVRAAAMAGIALLARESGRSGTASAALGWAVVALLVVEPRIVVDPGFQLSALATAGLIAWSARLTESLRRVAGGRLPGWLAEGLAISLAAQAATLPLVLVLFGRLALVAPVVNLAVVPLVPASMAAGLVALLAGVAVGAGLPGPLGTLLGLPAWLLLTVMVRIVQASAALPFASVTLEPPATHLAAAVVVGAGGVVAGRRRVAAGARRVATLLPIAGAGTRRAPAYGGRRPRPGATVSPRPGRPDRGHGEGPRQPSWRRLRYPLLGLAGVVLAVSLVAATRPDERAHVTMLDVGQGDAILVEGGRGGRLLVDGGPDPERLLVELDERLPPWDRRLDLVVLTHPHEDHVAGLALLLRRYRVGRVFEPGLGGAGPGYEAFLEVLRESGRRPEVLRTGDHLEVDDVHLTVLWPDGSAVPASPPETGRGVNDVSIVLLGEAGGRRFLLTGDAEDDIDPILLARTLPPVDVLKVAHHGSRTATSGALLDALRPTVALVSVGAGNTYGHPSRATLSRLEAHGARVYRSDLQGAVEVTLDPRAVTVLPERGTGGTSALLYHREDVGSRSRRGRLAAPLPPSAAVVPAARLRRRRDRRVAGRARVRGRARGRSVARRVRGPPPRCRQARAPGRSGRRAAARRRIRRLACRARSSRARGRSRVAPGHSPPRRPGLRAVAGRREPRGADRRLRG